MTTPPAPRRPDAAPRVPSALIGLGVGAVLGAVAAGLWRGAAILDATAEVQGQGWLADGLHGLALNELVAAAGLAPWLVVALALLGAVLAGRLVAAGGVLQRGVTGAALLVLGPVLLVIGAGLLVAPSVAVPRITADERPHVVLIVIDALRADHLGCYGYEKDTSPFLDGLAARGARFGLAVSQESYTLASAASYLTSTYPPTNGVLYDMPTIDTLRPRFTTLAEALQDEGYATAGFVFNPHLKARFAFDQGFEHYDDATELPAAGQAAHVHEVHETVAPMHAKVEAWLEETADDDRPRFLYLHYRDVHGPYVPPPPYHTMFLPEDTDPGLRELISKERCRPASQKGRLWDLFGTEPVYNTSQYDGEIRYTDEGLRLLFERLAEAGLTEEDTLFLVTADHGEEFFDAHPDDEGSVNHGRTLYTEQVHVPLIVSMPSRFTGATGEGRGSGGGLVIDTPVELVDMGPTILDVAGRGDRVPPSFAGRSLRGALQGDGLVERPVFAGGNHGRGLVIGRDLALFVYEPTTKDRERDHAERPEPDQDLEYRAQAFDLAADPSMTADVLPEGRAELSSLRALVDAWRLKEPATSGAQAELDEDTRRELEALGYLGGG